MIEITKKKKHNLSSSNKNLENNRLKKSVMTMSLNTIQFLYTKYRQQLLKKLYVSVNWGDAFIYFEKIRGNDVRFQDIINKVISLRNVLETYTINAILDFLKRAGLKILCISFNIYVSKFLSNKIK